MSDLILFSLGLVVTAFTVAAVVAVGLIDTDRANSVTSEEADDRSPA